MSDEERDESEGPREGESEHEWMQRMTSPELRWLDLFSRLTARVEANESRIGANEEESRRREERIQGRVEFLLQQQAQFNADMQQLREAQARAEEKWDRMWERTNGNINALLAVAEIQSQEIAGLAQAQARTDKQIAETNERLAETGERLNALVNVVERIISERRNGGHDGPAGGG